MEGVGVTVLCAQRQKCPNGHEHPAAGLVEAAPNPSEPWTDAVRNARDRHLSHELDGGKCAGHDDELTQQTPRGVDELRKECGKEQDRLGIRHRR